MYTFLHNAPVLYVSMNACFCRCFYRWRSNVRIHPQRISFVHETSLVLVRCPSSTVAFVTAKDHATQVTGQDEWLPRIDDCRHMYLPRVVQALDRSLGKVGPPSSKLVKKPFNYRYYLIETDCYSYSYRRLTMKLEIVTTTDSYP